MEIPAMLLPSLPKFQEQKISRYKKWYKTGTIVEVLPHHQYLIKVDGSGRVTLRSRRFLKTISPTKLNHMLISPSPIPQTIEEADQQPTIPIAGITNDPLNNTQSIPIQPYRTNVRIPRLLACLADYNKSGLQE